MYIVVVTFKGRWYIRALLLSIIIIVSIHVLRMFHPHEYFIILNVCLVYITCIVLGMLYLSRRGCADVCSGEETTVCCDDKQHKVHISQSSYKM